MHSNASIMTNSTVLFILPHSTVSARVMARVLSLPPSSSRLISATVPATVNVSLANWPKARNEQIPSGLLHASATSDMEVGAQYNNMTLYNLRDAFTYQSSSAAQYCRHYIQQNQNVPVHAYLLGITSRVARRCTGKKSSHRKSS